MTAEHVRLEEARERSVPWKAWGPYLSERQWGTVREDYSEGGDAWNYFTHDQARSRAYRWGEDGLAGISDDQQRLCFALALWNGKDPILKERLFGLTNSESNHGEDVKEYYFYLDSTPTHSYMKYLYKYPQAAFPYADLVETSRQPGPERVRVRAARHGGLRRGSLLRRVRRVRQGRRPRTSSIQISVHNRGPEPAELHVLPTLWFRNQWSWHGGRRPAGAAGRSPAAAADASSRPSTPSSASATSTARATPRCCSRRTRRTRSGSSASRTAPRTSRTASTTTSCTARRAGEPGEDRHQGGRPLSPDGRPRRVPDDPAAALRRRPDGRRPRATANGAGPFGGRFDEVFQARRAEADEFYAAVIPPSLDADAANVMRQALAGMLWSKQFYHYDVDKWLEERGSDPFKPTRQGRAAQRPLAPHVQRRRHLDAGQVGVPLVRGLGPRLPRPRPDARRPRLRQAAAEADAARAVHAPQRPDPGLRVELRRRQPAGPRLVHHLHLPPGEGAERARGTGSGSRAASRSCC